MLCLGLPFLLPPSPCSGFPEDPSSATPIPCNVHQSRQRTKTASPVLFWLRPSFAQASRLHCRVASQPQPQPTPAASSAATFRTMTTNRDRNHGSTTIRLTTSLWSLPFECGGGCCLQYDVPLPQPGSPRVESTSNWHCRLCLPTAAGGGLDSQLNCRPRLAVSNMPRAVWAALRFPPSPSRILPWFRCVGIGVPALNPCRDGQRSDYYGGEASTVRTLAAQHALPQALVPRPRLVSRPLATRDEPRCASRLVALLHELLPFGWSGAMTVRCVHGTTTHSTRVSDRAPWPRALRS
ncbi:uncharacterized protein IWZ02DRAFT_28370 [Phyllosticta citriasiana]|uniref:uncharacterized protein n=1 Tax=Phyllosticta citriasiana TaxID=595635 RepID=UPI0030FDF17F